MNIMTSELQPHDVPAFFPIFKNLLEQDFPGYDKKVISFFLEKLYTPYLFQYWIREKYKTVLVATNEEKIVGFAVIDSPYGGVSLCRWLGVLKNYQRKGIGKILIQRWTEIATKCCCHKIELAAQPEAKEFYEKVGLELEGMRHKSYFGIDQYIFGKVIGEPNAEIMTKY